MEEALQLQAEEADLEQYRCDADSLSSIRIECNSYNC